jgi:tripartite-type tricarboxylate transporter receptor subunit TctC
LVVPYPAGGVNDQIARMAQPDLESILKVGVNVVNIPGAGNMNAINHVLARENDDHTFIVTMDDFITGPLYLNNNSYKKFVATNIVGVVPYAFYGNSNKNLTTLKQQLKNKQLVNVGNNGVNGGGHLFLSDLTGSLKFNLVPYKGSNPLILDVIAGHVEYGTSTLSAIKEQVDAGKLVPLMVSGDKRSTVYPNVPTMKELGFKNTNVKSWFGIFARQDTSKESVSKMSDTLSLIISNNYKIQNFKSGGMTISNLSGEDANKYYNKQIEHFETTKK